MRRKTALKGISMLLSSLFRVAKRPIVRIEPMNTLIIVTAVLTGPINSNVDTSTEASITKVNTMHQAAFAAFEGPSTAIALGAGDSLGCELYNVELVARLETAEQTSIAFAE